jgi:hypothetical protein
VTNLTRRRPSGNTRMKLRRNTDPQSESHYPGAPYHIEVCSLICDVLEREKVGRERGETGV